MKYKHLNILLFIIASELIQHTLTAVLTTTEVSTGQGAIACYNPTNCQNSSCREFCTDCDNASECSMCDYGFFLYHTPDNTIECIKCPYFSPTETSLNIKFKCASCLEMPTFWEYSRKCEFKYYYKNDDVNYTPFNVTINKPEIFKIIVDDTATQVLTTTRYDTQIMTGHCGLYVWKNYEIQSALAATIITQRLNNHNNPECTKCLDGYIFQPSDNTCVSCDSTIQMCISCYENPLNSQLACQTCLAGYIPNDNQNECIQCQTIIDNCTTCYFNPNHSQNECITCADGFRISTDAITCELIDCTDDNCSSCVTSNDVCEQCVARYKVKNGACIVNKECGPGMNQSQCSTCYSTITAILPQCLYCFLDSNSNPKCGEVCKIGYGLNYVTRQCRKCSNFATAVADCTNCEFTDTNNDGTLEYECFACSTGMGYDSDQNLCVDCEQSQYTGSTGCIDCEISSGTFTCIECSTSGYGLDNENNICVTCSTYDTDCTACEIVLQDPAPSSGSTYIFECTTCNNPKSPVPAVHGDGGSASSCSIICNNYFNGNCNTCEQNTKYQQPTADETYYYSQKLTCPECKSNSGLRSINFDGSDCLQNQRYCRSSLQIASNDVVKLNYWYGQNHQGHFCYNSCHGTLGNNENFFLDPLIQKCVKCENNSTQCRKNINFKQYFYCQSFSSYHQMLQNETPASALTANWNDILQFNFDFAASPYSQWDAEGYTNFVFDIIFIGSSSDPELNYCDIGTAVWDITSNIADYIFRLNTVQVSFKTFDNDTGSFNTVNMEFNTIEFDLKITGLTKFVLNNIEFVGGAYQTPEQQYSKRKQGGIIKEYVPIKVTMKDNLPNSQFQMENVIITSTDQYILIPQFFFEDLGKLTITKFDFTAINTDSNQQTGFQIFNFYEYRGISVFNLNIQDFTLSNMLISDTILLNIPLKKARVILDNIHLTNCVFKNAFLIKDTSSGFGKGEIWLEINHLIVENTQLYDTTIVYVKNSMYFLAANWKFKGILMALYDQLESEIVRTNTFIFDNLQMEAIVLYKCSLFKQIRSPSIVEYYEEGNEIENLTIKDITIYAEKESFPLDFLVPNGQYLKMENIEIRQIHIAKNLKINANVNTFLVNQKYNIKAISSYTVIALTETEIPEYFIYVSETVKGSNVIVQELVADDIDSDFNIMFIQNAAQVEIDKFQCIQSTQPELANRICIMAQNSQTSLDKFVMTNSIFKNLKNIENPFRVSGFQSYVLEYNDFELMEVQYGLIIQPAGVTTVYINKCIFQEIVTNTKLKAVIESAGLYLDFTLSTQVDNLNIVGTVFNGIFSRYKSAGIHLIDPTIQIKANITDCLFNNVHSIFGGVFNGKFGSKDNVEFHVTNTTIVASSSDTHFNITDLTHANNPSPPVNATAPNNKNYQTVKSLITKAQEALARDGETDPLLTSALIQPTAFFVQNAKVYFTNVTFEGIHHQQTFTILDSEFHASEINMTDSYCNECSQVYQGASYLGRTKFNITNSTFNKCHGYSGGALYITGATTSSNEGTEADIGIIQDSNFTDNYSLTQGGALFIQNSYYKIIKCEFTNNRANGIIDKQNDVNSIRGQGGGIYATIANNLNNSLLYRRVLANVTNEQQYQQRRRLSSFQMLIQDTKFNNNYAQLGGAGKLIGVQTTITGTTFTGNNGTINGDDLFSQCGYGEGTLQDGSCEQCGANKYSLNLKSPACVGCVPNAQCPGRDVIIVNKYYWRPHNYSNQVKECYNNKINCLGGKENFTCSQGYIGALCEACDLSGKQWGKQYSVVKPYTCGDCGKVVTNAINVSVGNIITLVSMLLAVKGTIKLIQDRIMLKAIQYLFKGFRADEDETGILIKMFTNYFQIISIIATFRINLPNSMTDVQDKTGNPVKSMGNALDCYLINIQSTIPHIYFKIIWQLVVNLSQFTAFIFLFTLLKIAKKTTVSFKSLLWTTFIYLIVFLQPSYVNAILEVVSCRKIAGYNYVLGDVSYYCYSQEYNQWTYSLLVPFLLFWVIIVPLFIFLMLYSNYKCGQLLKPHTLYKFGFIYQEYELDRYYWELIKIYQKILIVSIINIYSQQIKTKAILVFLVVFVYGIISYFIKPYGNDRLNKIDVISSVVCSLSLIIGIFIYNNGFQYWVDIGFMSILLLNAVFIVFMIKQILRKVINDIAKNHGDKIEQAKAKSPCLNKIITISPSKMLKAKGNWKILAKQVHLFGDGLKCGICTQIIPVDDPLMVKAMLRNKRINDGEDIVHQDDHLGKFQSLTSKVIQKKAKVNSKLNLFATFAKDDKRASKTDLEAKHFADEIHKINSIMHEGHDKISNQFLDQFGNPILDEWEGRKYTSIEVLENTISEEELGQITQRVAEWRQKKFEILQKQKEIYRAFFKKELNWVDIKALREKQQKEKEEKQMRKKAEKKAKKDGRRVTEIFQELQDEKEGKIKEPVKTENSEKIKTENSEKQKFQEHDNIQDLQDLVSSQDGKKKSAKVFPLQVKDIENQQQNQEKDDVNTAADGQTYQGSPILKASDDLQQLIDPPEEDDKKTNFDDIEDLNLRDNDINLG